MFCMLKKKKYILCIFQNITQIRKNNLFFLMIPKVTFNVLIAFSLFKLKTKLNFIKKNVKINIFEAF